MKFQLKQAKLKHVAIFLAVIYAVSMPPMAYADWSFSGLGNLGRSDIHATAINDSGQVTGFFNTSVPPIFNSELNHAFITGPNGIGMTDLGTLGGSDSRGFGINDSGQVVGMSLTASNDDYKVIITGPNGVGMTDLGSVSGVISSGINDSGQIARNFSNQAFITGPNGVGMTDLGNLGRPFGAAEANDINNSGQVAGASETADFTTHAFITGPNGVDMVDLGTLGGGFSHATGINESGQVVGVSNTAALPRDQHAFVTGPDGSGMTDLGTLGGRFSEAFSINDSGEVIGMAQTASNDFHAFIYSHGGITDLNLLDVVVAAGWTFLSFSDINNNGQIVGHGINSEGNSEVFLLSYTPDTVFTPNPIFVPIPEPETYIMLLAGLGLLGFMVHRRKEIVM